MNYAMTIISNMNISERKDGRYEGRITIEGKRKSFYGKTKSEVKNKAKEYLNKIENGYKEPQRIILNDYIEYWLKTYKYTRIEPTSYTRLYRVYECQIKPTIGTLYIGNVTTKAIQNLIDEFAKPTKKETKALAKSGLKRIMQLLRPCLERAVIEGVIQKNPCNDVILPTDSYIETETKKQITLSDNQIEEFKKLCLMRYKNGEYKSRDAIVLLIMLNLGLRVGEVLALEWRDIDFERGLVHINKTVQSNIVDFDSKQRTIINKVKDSTKTKAGERVLSLNKSTIWLFEELKKYDIRKNIVSPYVTATQKGTRNTARNMQRSLNRVKKGSVGVPQEMTLHTLRHTFGSTLIRRGVSIEIVSKLMGHANITITYLKYIHVLQEQEAKTMQMVNIC